jgi:hypothetical protein
LLTINISSASFEMRNACDLPYGVAVAIMQFFVNPFNSEYFSQSTTSGAWKILFLAQIFSRERSSTGSNDCFVVLVVVLVVLVVVLVVFYPLVI